MQMIYRLLLSLLLALQLSLASTVPSHAHVSGELAGGYVIDNEHPISAEKHNALNLDGVDDDTRRVVEMILNGERLDPILAASNAALMGQMDAAAGRKVSNLYKTNRPVSERRIAPNGGAWTVDPSFRSADEAAGVLVNGSYIKNPTARNLSDCVTASGKVRVDGQLANGQYMYVVDPSVNIVIGTRGGQRMPHPTLIGGSNPQVQAAGIVDIRGGKIYSVDNASGHFKPGNGSLQNAESAFGGLPSNSFHTDFKGYVPFDG